MKFDVFHMRNYQSYCETENSVEEINGVELDGLEEAVKKLLKHSFITEFDWIQIELSDIKPYFDEKSDLYLWPGDTTNDH